MINIFKNKYIDGYVSKLNGIINKKIELFDGVGDLIDPIIRRV